MSRICRSANHKPARQHEPPDRRCSTPHDSRRKHTLKALRSHHRRPAAKAVLRSTSCCGRRWAPDVWAAGQADA